MKIDISGGPAPDSLRRSERARGSMEPRRENCFHAGKISRASSRWQPPGELRHHLFPSIRSNQQLTLRWPVFLPDGHHSSTLRATLCPRRQRATNGIYLGSLDGKDRKFLVQADSDALYAPPGYLLFLKGDDLDGATYRHAPPGGDGRSDPCRRGGGEPQGLPPRSFLRLSVRRSGVRGGWAGLEQVAWLDAAERQLGDVGEPGTIRDLRLSPDGRDFGRSVAGGQERRSLAGGPGSGCAHAVYFQPRGGHVPSMVAGWNEIAFSSMRSGQFDIYVKPTNGTGTARPLVQDNARKFVDDWSSDGRYIAYMRDNPQGENGSDIWILPLFGDKKPFPFLASPFNEAQASFSPDDRWLAYVSDDSGKFEVYVVPFPQGNGKWQVSTEGGSARLAAGREGTVLCLPRRQAHGGGGSREKRLAGIRQPQDLVSDEFRRGL